ncbi:hypothetical protein [Flavobacterium sp.]|jgi:hypothetical protein|uniref:hypothetical protein n=1 Tax=Flavobacterium sp. TaxID=239 RepID=UPI00333E1A16
MKNLFTRKFLSFLTFFMVCSTAFAQKLESKEKLAPAVVIFMDFNKSLYSKSEGNAYFSEDPKAALVGMIVPKKYSVLMEEMKKDGADGVKNLQNGEFENSGQKYFFYSGNIIAEKTKEFFLEVLLKELDENHCVVVTSMFQPAHKDIFGKEAKKAIISAQILN